MSITAQREAELLAKVPTGLLINGEWRDASDGGTFDVLDPATGEKLLTLASATSEDAMAALDAADAVQAEWALTAPRERAEILRRAFDLVTERKDDFALLMSLEMGKPLAEAYGEVTYGAEFLRWFSEEAVRHYGRYLTTPEGKNKVLVQHKPVGPCLLITPWNFPLAMATRKVGPAVAAGCTMVLKPAKLTPLTSQLFAATMMEAGLPAGVLNVVSGASASKISGPLMQDDRLRKVSFTGSTPVGKQLMKDAADKVLRTSMELGGNAPFIVFEDADLDAAVEGAMAAKMRNMGEACTAANRFLVHEDVAEEFTAKFAAAMKALKPGRGTEADTTVGPLVEEKARDEVHSLVEAAVAAGATAITGGAPVDGPGYFYQPTVLANVANDAKILSQEIFGPVAPVTTFKDEAQAIKLANSTEYGLASYIYSQDFNRMFRVSEQIEFGLVGFNAGVISNAAAPFGGVKQSGLGREGGAEGLEEYTTVQYIGIADPYAAKK
ncbi:MULTISPECIES: NAD-dependent succinate-semialdehyde dehydrogenase [Micrococcaceae]|uniref:NAD-dependent succinate-semialdehyde dehydrogenase n=1 Tax=Micrococcaceae TaxID=1268 RepID=UPI000CFAC4C4|nr:MULTISPECIES: NAD-dependent succinate-semialdehyde dehydrogenase [unclassified Arthrobacter]MCS3492455.1 succinate-semialdehyde dehydrogenase/glutarate-semialdehyde dehydrogenase [Arthrobacter sp. JUb119]PQZ87937.1 NAD-dependent succinate-semialdehyde dehydrogenase [Arthrobacter sp. MYb222]PRB76733.1 NAD-dependent succinate-semialdehyde dehydrogenase [Arthrobacter sp. MYb214]TDU30404.1 succinate-semialdehyde dehydrogenase/glutarate-semialdehyde dehydrogenase [Arthrobacter sp. JUb115]